MLNLTIYPLSSLATRRSDHWVFGHARGLFAGNGKYLYLWTAINRPDIVVTWLTEDRAVRDRLVAAGYRAHMRWSPGGMLAALRGGVFFFDHSISDVNLQLGRGAFLVNLWHGVGLKATQLGDKGGVISRHQKYRRNLLTRLIFLDYLTVPDRVVTTSGFMQTHFATQFQIDEQRCPQLGYPRLDCAADPVLKQAAMKLDRSSAGELAFDRFDEVYIYMPTYRDTDRPFLDEAIPDFARLSDILKARNAFLYVKLHPRTEGRIPETVDNIGPWPGDVDLYTYLDNFDVMITDYSSVFYDFLFVKNRGSILYTFDYERYASEDRQLLYPFEENVTGARASTFEELCALLASGAAMAKEPDADFVRVRDKFWDGSARPASPEVVRYVEAIPPRSHAARSERGRG